MIRRSWIGAHADITQKRQCVLAGVSRTTVYAKRQAVVFSEIDEVLKCLIDEEYTRHPFYGSRKNGGVPVSLGHRVNRKRVQRLMRSMFLAGMAQGRTRAWRAYSTRCARICCVACLILPAKNGLHS